MPLSAASRSGLARTAFPVTDLACRINGHGFGLAAAYALHARITGTTTTEKE